MGEVYFGKIIEIWEEDGITLENSSSRTKEKRIGNFIDVAQIPSNQWVGIMSSIIFIAIFNFKLKYETFHYKKKLSEETISINITLFHT